MRTATASSARERVRTRVRPSQRSGKASREGGLRPSATEGAHQVLPAIVSVFFHTDGTICHSWCGRPLEFHGSRGGLELDFFCTRCIEHVTLPQSVLSRVPVLSGV